MTGFSKHDTKLKIGGFLQTQIFMNCKFNGISVQEEETSSEETSSSETSMS